MIARLRYAGIATVANVLQAVIAWPIIALMLLTPLAVPLVGPGPIAFAFVFALLAMLAFSEGHVARAKVWYESRSGDTWSRFSNIAALSLAIWAAAVIFLSEPNSEVWVYVLSGATIFPATTFITFFVVGSSHMTNYFGNH